MIKIGDYFQSFAVKRLADVDVNRLKSNQHEFNGSEQLRAMLGQPVGKLRIRTRMVYLDDDQDEFPELAETSLTWYDSRLNNPSRPAEYRLLYPASAESVIYRAKAGDTMFLAMDLVGDLLLVIAQQDSTILRQLQWIFSLHDQSPELVVATSLDGQPEKEEVASEQLLGLLGIEVKLPDQDLDLILERFPSTLWPSTADFASFARSLTPGVDPVADPDRALMEWVTLEHRLFRTLEKHRIAESIADGFLAEDDSVDVEHFLQLSLSIHNRRKSRAGLSLEEHLNAIFISNSLAFVKKAKTEGKKEPDFLFPSKAAYDDPEFPSDKLTMLGSKTTLKDRWRQVLNEADRVPFKHLFTLQPAISEAQTSEMIAERLQLVVPRQIHATGYSFAQQAWLMDLETFVKEVRMREKK